MEIKKSHLPLVIISVVTKVRSSNSSYFLSHIYDVGSRGLRLNHESDWTQAGPSAMQKADCCIKEDPEQEAASSLHKLCALTV